MTSRALFLLLTLTLVAQVPGAPAARADDPQSFTLTTDTPQYCAQLAKQVTDRHSTLPDVKRLLAEGRDLCDRGEVRGGIRRLRRALVMLHHRRTAKEQPVKPVPAPTPKDPALKSPEPAPPAVPPTP